MFVCAKKQVRRQIPISYVLDFSLRTAMSPSKKNLPYKKYQCRVRVFFYSFISSPDTNICQYFDDRGRPLTPSCREGNACRCVFFFYFYHYPSYPSNSISFRSIASCILMILTGPALNVIAISIPETLVRTQAG